MDDNRLRIPGKTEFSFFTERDPAAAAIGVGDEAAPFKYNPQAHYEAICQWVNKTRPRKKSFDGSTTEGGSIAPVWTDGDDFLLSDTKSQISMTAAAAAELLHDEWQKKEFDRAFASLRRKYEPEEVDEAFETRRVLEKVNRFRKAFLKGFFEARIRRIEANKWVYDKLHVEPECIKEKYRKLMFDSHPQYCPDESNKARANQVEGDGRAEHYDGKSEAKDDEAQEDDRDTESVFSFVPERDNVLLQDENAPPAVRGFGNDKYMKYDSSIRLLNLNNWLPPDVQRFLDEKRLQQIRAMEEMQQEKVAREVEAKVKAPKNIDWKYEQIPGMNVDVPQWLGPKKLDEQELERERNPHQGSQIGEPQHEDQQQHAVNDLVAYPKGREEAAGEFSSDSKEDYKLWYSTHDLFSTTPFMEARLQRLLREVLGKRDWKLFCSYVRDKSNVEVNVEKNGK